MNVPTTSNHSDGEKKISPGAQQIATPEEEMLSIFNSFDNRLSKVTDLICEVEEEEEDKSSYQSCSDGSLSPPTEEAADDDVLQLNENLAPSSDIDMVEHAESSIQVPMSRLDNDRVYRSIWLLSQYFAANTREIDDLIHADSVVEFKAVVDRMVRSGYEKCCVDESSRPTQGGEIHPVNRNVMNYVKFLVVHSDTLNTLLESDDDEMDLYQNDDGNRLQEQESTSPFARRLLSWISLLESKLKEKSRLYEDGALTSIFLMNNILYVVEEVKGSNLRKFLGEHWVREHHVQIHQYVISYLRASWGKALSCLKDEGTSAKACLVALTEKLKNFNTNFEEIYRTQTAWSVPDPQLCEELRISILEKLIPAYRSFVGRFRWLLESNSHGRKCIKYTPEDLEKYLQDLFEGDRKCLMGVNEEPCSICY